MCSVVCFCANNYTKSNQIDLRPFRENWSQFWSLFHPALDEAVTNIENKVINNTITAWIFFIWTERITIKLRHQHFNMKIDEEKVGQMTTRALPWMSSFLPVYPQIRLDYITVLSQCDLWEIRGAFPGEIEQPYSTAQPTPPPPPPPPPPCVQCFFCFHTTDCEAYSFTTDGYEIFNVRTHVGACCIHTKGGEAQTSLHKQSKTGWLLAFK